jgi:hypothetical protein
MSDKKNPEPDKHVQGSTEKPSLIIKPDSPTEKK